MTAAIPLALRRAPALNRVSHQPTRRPHENRGMRQPGPQRLGLTEDGVEGQRDHQENGVVAHARASHRRRQSSSPPGRPRRTHVPE